MAAEAWGRVDQGMVLVDQGPDLDWVVVEELEAVQGLVVAEVRAAPEGAAAARVCGMLARPAAVVGPVLAPAGMELAEAVGQVVARVDMVVAGARARVPVVGEEPAAEVDLDRVEVLEEVGELVALMVEQEEAAPALLVVAAA